MNPWPLQGLIKHLNAVKMPYSVLISDVGEKIEEDKTFSVKTQPGLEFFSVYQNIEDVKQYMHHLASKYPDFVSVILVGSSYEGRLLQLLKDRLWRKTRSRHSNPENCIGVDANRNWDAAWNDAAGSSSNPCSHNYAGPEAFSEPETKSVSEFMLQELQGRLQIFMDFHSYSQRWLTPWGYTSNLPPNYQQQKRLAEVATKALQKVNGTKYSVGSTGTIFYTVTGGARDWAYDVISAKNSYVIELKDKGEYGFILPKRHILPTAKETWEGVKAMALELIKNLEL